MSFLEPIIEETSSTGNVNMDIKPKTWRVPVFKKADTFIIWPGLNCVRYYDQESLPALIKARLGLIMSSPLAAELNKQEMSNTDFEQSNVQSEVYLNKFGKEYADIGWQYNKYYYCIVVDDNELKELRETT